MTSNHPINNRLPFSERLIKYEKRLPKIHTHNVEGVLTRTVGLALEAKGCQVSIGARCHIVSANGEKQLAEVIGFADDIIYLMPLDHLKSVSAGARVIPTQGEAKVTVSNHLLGRILNGEGIPIDGKGLVTDGKEVSLYGRALNPLLRSPIEQNLDVGVRAINGLLTVGRGQRMGLFAGSGVGKSVLLGMMTKYTAADVIVVGLIGERGREVQEFITNILGSEGLSRSVVVAVPADQSPLMRFNGAMVTTAVAEYFRDKGKNVLLLVDSLTRFCQAQRELALAVGELPATKGYPPSVFAKLPQLVERAGNSDRGEGSITAFYTVLTEGDDQQDPIADAARAILDGHVVLSRRLAEMGQYPAIDIEGSVSRVMPQIVDVEHLDYLRQFKQLYSTYQQNRDLISVGAYQRGADKRIDEAITMLPSLNQYLSQRMNEKVDFPNSYSQLVNILTSATTIA